jgi:hypothetical protein
MEISAAKQITTEEKRHIALSPVYNKMVLAMGFKENRGRQVYYGDGSYIHTHFNFRPGEGFYFDHSGHALFFTEESILHGQNNILARAREQEYADFFPYFAKIEDDSDASILLAMTVLCLMEDSEIYRILAHKASPVTKIRRRKAGNGE